MKKVQVWKKFSPFISDNTNEILLNRTSLLEAAAKTDYQGLYKFYVKIRSLKTLFYQIMKTFSMSVFTVGE